MGDVRVPSAEELREYARHVRPQYACTPADALQCQLDAMAEAVKLTHAGPHVAGPDWMNARNRVDDVRQFTIAPLYFWTARIADVVEQASRSYPLQPETFLPTLPQAFCVFERPVLWAVIDGVRSGSVHADVGDGSRRSDRRDEAADSRLGLDAPAMLGVLLSRDHESPAHPESRRRSHDGGRSPGDLPLDLLSVDVCGTTPRRARRGARREARRPTRRQTQRCADVQCRADASS